MPMLLTALIAGCAFLLGLRVGIAFGKRAQRKLSSEK
jgi:hypothetical protein